jgi:hypothetical protein
LVEAGTITQAQADAVRAALEAAGPIGRPGHGFGHKGVSLDTAAGALGMTAEELRTALAGGQSLAQVAQARGVDRQVVIDALVAEARSSAAERVAEGDITQAEADEKLADVVERVTAMVDGQFAGRRFGPGPRPGDDDAAEGSNSSTVFRTRSAPASGSSV